MLIAPFYPVKEAARRRRMLKKMGCDYFTYKPKISVIVPAKNEEVGILKTVGSIVDNGYDNCEVLVINDGSTDKTEEVVQEYINKYADEKGKIRGIEVKLFSKPNSGKGASLSYGIQRSTGQIILTVDADSALAPDALSNLIEYFKDENIKGVVGNVKIAENYTFIGLIQKLEYLFGFYFKRTHAVMGAEYIFGGACAAFRREVFEKLGLYDESNKTEDIEMSMRLRYNGYAAAYAEDVICYTEGASTIGGPLNQRLRWKKGRFDTFIKYRSMFFSGDAKHNKFLSWVVLPFALLSELQLFFEPISISLLIAYSFISIDFVSLTLGILFIFNMYLICSMFTKDGLRFDLLLLFPGTWMLFYILVWVEYLALIQSVRMVWRGQNVEWQTWHRKGIYDLE